MTALLILSWLTPLLAAPVALRPGSRWPLILAPLPALLTALLVTETTQLSVPWLLLGAQFGLEGSSRVFLLFSALLWLVAALQTPSTLTGDPRAGRFRLFYLLAMAGNFWLIVAQDLVNFYLGFSLMGLAAYGLVIHDGKPASLRAGRVYLAMTLVAETALFAALLLIFRHTASLVPSPSQLIGLSDWAIGLLVFGLGIKAGLIPVHVWLPLAHPAAPVPASAVLSGSMIKAALIGWLKFLPIGEQASGDWAQLLVVLGALTLLYALPTGLLQTNPKVVLAYSSVSKMGLMTAMLGLALGQPELAPAMLTVLVFYATLHGLAKGALFLGVGVSRSSATVWILPILALPALALAGAPFTAGALTKTLLEPSLAALEGWEATLLPLVLILSSLVTTLLLGRFLILMAAEPRNGASAKPLITLPWLLLIGLLLGMPWLAKAPFPAISSSWPVALGALLVLLMASGRWRWASRLPGRVPAGDVLEPTLRWLRAGRSWITTARQGPPIRWDRLLRTFARRTQAPATAWPLVMEQTLSLWPVAGILALLSGIALLLLLGTSG